MQKAVVEHNSNGTCLGKPKVEISETLPNTTPSKWACVCYTNNRAQFDTVAVGCWHSCCRPLMSHHIMIKKISIHLVSQHGASALWTFHKHYPRTCSSVQLKGSTLLSSPGALQAQPPCCSG